MADIRIFDKGTEAEARNRAAFVKLFKESPIPDGEILNQLGLYLRRQTLTRLLFIHELYRQILDVNGNIMEFGVRWGQNLALFDNLRAIYEPFNYTRQIIGFDTFTGFPAVDKADGQADIASVGALAVTDAYEDYLTKVLDFHESESPIGHIKKYKLVKGDASASLGDYLDRHPETVLALVYFDFDIYSPTKDCLERIIPHLTRGSVIAFDELNHPEWPGETIAVREVIGTNKLKLRRSPLSGYASYAVWGE